MLLYNARVACTSGEGRAAAGHSNMMCSIAVAAVRDRQLQSRLTLNNTKIDVPILLQEVVRVLGDRYAVVIDMVCNNGTLMVIHTP